MGFSVLLLILVPICFGIMFLVSDSKKYFKILSILLSGAMSALAVISIFRFNGQLTINGDVYSLFAKIFFVLEIVITIFLFWVTVKHRRWGVFCFVVIQTLINLYSEFFMKKSEEFIINIDKLSIIMLLIVNVVGSLIVVFSNGYITEYEEHRKLKSKQKLYYAIICIFLAAMNGLVISDSLSTIYIFWEITTLVSFILISYNRDEEAYKSGFRALALNLIGGISFSIGIIMFSNISNINLLSQVGRVREAEFAVIPVLLLCIAGFAKSAQFPFQSWLLGAMVAPTPVSALLHSSTMVNAGVYLIIKLSPAYAGTKLGIFVAIYGGFSFFICSVIAVSQQNAKRILAYSTIANLGLIISSSGMGTSIAVAAAVTLIIFHAISKALLFLCAGQIEHTIGSRDLEDMTGLVHKAPLLSFIAAFGMFSMILPPFGVLITKWITIESAASNPIVAIFIIFGSAFTTVFWVKWIGTILSSPLDNNKVKFSMEKIVSIPLLILSSMVLLTSIFISFIFNNFVFPEIGELLHVKNNLTAVNGNISSGFGSFNDGIVFAILFIAFVIYYFEHKRRASLVHIKNVYMCGENNDEDVYSFRSANGVYEKAKVSNIYLRKVINEKTISDFGYCISIVLIISAAIGGLI